MRSARHVRYVGKRGGVAVLTVRLVEYIGEVRKAGRWAGWVRRGELAGSAVCVVKDRSRCRRGGWTGE